MDKNIGLSIHHRSPFRATTTVTHRECYHYKPHHFPDELPNNKNGGQQTVAKETYPHCTEYSPTPFYVALTWNTWYPFFRVIGRRS